MSRTKTAETIENVEFPSFDASKAIDQMRRAIAHLQRSCHRLIWMNPLMGAPGYEPLTLGLQAALPFVDDFLPAHNLANLEALGLLLLESAGRRPMRRQMVLGASA